MCCSEETRFTVGSQPWLTKILLQLFLMFFFFSFLFFTRVSTPTPARHPLVFTIGIWQIGSLWRIPCPGLGAHGFMFFLLFTTDSVIILVRALFHITRPPRHPTRIPLFFHTSLPAFFFLFPLLTLCWGAALILCIFKTRESGRRPAELCFLFLFFPSFFASLKLINGGTSCRVVLWGLASQVGHVNEWEEEHTTRWSNATGSLTGDPLSFSLSAFARVHSLFSTSCVVNLSHLSIPSEYPCCWQLWKIKRWGFPSGEQAESHLKLSKAPVDFSL